MFTFAVLSTPLFWTLALFSFVKPSVATDIDMEGLPDTGLNTSSWKTGKLPFLYSLWSLDDFQIAAKNTLSSYAYVNYRTGALNEYTYQANLDIWKHIRLRGFTFRDVSKSNMSTSILGYTFKQPFFIAPAANAGLASPSAELSLVGAAASSGILYVPSISSTKSIEEIADARKENQTLFHQEYVWSNKTRNAEELQRMEAAGYKAVFLTVDNTGINGLRTRSQRNIPSSETGHDAAFDLASLAEFRNLTTLPIVPKGIKTWQDAKTCLDLGFPAIYVSNHGGRMLDTAPTAVEVLLDIRKHAPEVFDGMEVYADGGVRTGTDVIKLLALGARAVGLGRSAMFANIYGQAGVERMISLLSAELKSSLALMGVNRPSELDGTYVNTATVKKMFLD